MRSALLDTMIEAATAAGDRLKRDFADLASLDVRFKNGAGDPFSEADLRAAREHIAVLTALPAGPVCLFWRPRWPPRSTLPTSDSTSTVSACCRSRHWPSTNAQK